VVEFVSRFQATVLDSSRAVSEDQIAIGEEAARIPVKTGEAGEFCWPTEGIGRETFARGGDSTQAIENQLLS
jgi:hypothetical protein